MINILFNDFSYEVLPKQKEMFDKYCQIIQWGRRNPTRFMEQFLGLELTDHQKYILLSSWTPSTVVWLMSRSSGKNLPLTTKVYGKVKDRDSCGLNGDKYPEKTIGDLKVGDLIYDDTGELTEVIHLNPIVFDNVYKITFDDGEVIECGAEHLWSVCENTISRKNGEVCHVVKESVRNADFLFHHFQREKKIENRKHENDYRFWVNTTKPLNYPNYQNLTIDPYLLGVWLGDGHSSAPVITFSGDDVAEMSALLAPYSKLVIVKKDENKKNCYFIFVDREKDLVEKYGKIDKKSCLIQKLKYLGLYNNKHIPKRYLFGTIEQRVSLLQGLMDTDGTIDKLGHCEFTQTNKVLMDDVCTLLTSLGIKYTLMHKTKTNYIKKDGNEADTWRLYFTSSKQMPCFRLKRKYDRLSDEPLKHSNRKTIINVERLEEKKPMRCITVGNNSGRFLCGEKATVTHNSFMSAPLLMARGLLLPNTNAYIMAPSGGQAQETFSKMEDLAKGNIASVLGVTQVFFEETMRQNAGTDPFVHDKNSYHVSLYNGSTINTLNSVAKNIVGKHDCRLKVRSNFI